LNIITNLIKKDLKLLISDPLSLLFMLFLPIVISLVAQTVFSPKKTSGFVISVAFVDQDKSPLSDFLSGAFANDKMKDYFNFIKMTEKEGITAIENNEIGGMFIITKGFEKKFFNGEKCNLTLITNPARTISTGILEDVFSIMTDMLDGSRVLFKDELKTVYNMDGFNSIKLLELTKIGYDKIQAMKGIVLENRLEFEKEEKTKKGVTQSMGIYFLPGMAFLTIMFVVAGFFKKLVQETEEMTITRILASSANSSHILIAKFLFILIAIISVQIILWLFAVPMFHINVLNYFLFAKGIFFMAALGTIFLALIYSIPLKARAIEAISSVLIIVVCLLGGIFITPHTLPNSISKIMNLSPFYFPIKIMNSSFGLTETGISMTNQLIFVAALIGIGIAALYLFRNKINKIAKG